MTDLERAARALYGYARVIPGDAALWEDAEQDVREHVRGAVCAVLTALREPGSVAGHVARALNWDAENIAEVWRAMIDHILSEPAPDQER